MFFLTPKYLKQAKLLHKGVTRFIHYKRDLLPQAKLDEINALRTELEGAIKARDQKRLKALHEEINSACDRALPAAKIGWVEDHTEVIFVSLVIALGIRAYIAQPFQIPTGSMQPTLNGITAQRTEADPSPGLLGSITAIFQSATHLNVVSDHDGDLDSNEPLTEHQLLIFRPYCKLHFADGHTIKINCPMRQLVDELQLPANLRAGADAVSGDTPDMRSNYMISSRERIHIRKGQVLARGIVRSGDHVIVNKFAYHFRTPTRGEVFVFTTKNISGIPVPREQGSQHYIKRLGGVPGDTIDINPPELLHNGKPAVEAGFRRVIDGSAGSPHRQGYYGYQGYSRDGRYDLPITLEKSPRRQYFALGDNSYNSSDSRYWGVVPEQNVVGPGWFCYWPLTSHFGVIR